MSYPTLSVPFDMFTYPAIFYLIYQIYNMPD